MRWSTACPDWETRIVERRSLIPLDPLYPDEAEAALAVFKSLRAVDVAGQPTLGECCEPFVFEFVAAIFGAYDHERARRLIRDFMLLISKKNAKSTIAAGIMVTAIVRNWRQLAELLILAPSIEVAHNSFAPAAGMVRADPDLSAILHVVEHKRTIKHLVTGAELKIVAADSDVAAGKKAGFVLVEELWLFGKKPKAAAMLREATGGLAARPEGFVIYISTHSDEPPAGVFKEKLEYFRDVRDGKVQDSASLGVLYEWPAKMLEEEAYLDPANFYVTNPNIDRSVSGEWLQAELEKAMRGEGEGKQVFLAKHLNVEIGLRTRRDRWRGADYWEGAADPTLTFEGLLSRSEVVVLAADGGGLDDLYGFCAAGREKETGRWLFWYRAWAQAEVFERRKDIAPALADFAADGDLVICDHATQDIEEIAALGKAALASGLLPDKAAVGLDPYGIGMLIDELILAGFSEEQIRAVPQGYKLNGAICAQERKLKDKTAIHNGSRMMNWVVSNAKAEQAGNAVKITKQQAGRAKIDPLCAGFNATELLQLNPEAAGSSFWMQDEASAA